MRRIGWAASAAVALVAGVVACSSSSSSGGSGNSLFPFTGPSCVNGPPGVAQVSAACTSCVDSACSSQGACIKTDCADLFTCECACAMGDTTCIQKCGLPSSTCQTCLGNSTMCIGQASAGSCSSDCTKSSSSGGTGDAGATG